MPILQTQLSPTAVQDTLVKLGISPSALQETISKVSNLEKRIELVISDFYTLEKLNTFFVSKADFEAHSDYIDTSLKAIPINYIIDSIYELREAIADLRSALDEKADKPKQKGDLEIFSPIVWDEDFLRILNEPIKFDF